jgi:hypothetical protein
MKRFIIKDPPGTYKPDDVDVEFVVPSHHNLEQVLEQFTLFLKASGFYFDGFCDIIDYDDLK